MDRVRALALPLFFISSLVSLAGDWLTTVAVGILVFEITGSSAAPAVYFVLRAGARLAGPFVGGTLADRFSPARALTVVWSAQAALAGLLYEAAVHRSAAAIYVAVALSQVVGSATRPMQQAALPRLVRPGAVKRTLSSFSAFYMSVFLGAPAAGYALLKVGGPQLLIGIDVASFVAAVALMLPVRIGRATVVVPLTVRGALEGLGPVLSDRVLRAAAGSYAGAAVATGAAQSALVVLAADRLGGADASGLLYGALGAGGLVSGILLTSRPPAHITRDLLFGAAVLSILPLVCLGASTHLWEALALLFVSTLGSTASDAWNPTEIARRVPSHLIGRANAVILMGSFVGLLAGSLAAAILIPTVGWPATVIGVGAAGLTIAFAVAMTGGVDTVPAGTHAADRR